MKNIIANLNLPIKDENYYAKKAEDILNDKKEKQKIGRYDNIERKKYGNRKCNRIY